MTTGIERRLVRLEDHRCRQARPPSAGAVWDFSALSLPEQSELDDLLALIEPLPHERRRRLTTREAARLDELWARVGIGGEGGRA